MAHGQQQYDSLCVDMTRKLVPIEEVDFYFEDDTIYTPADIRQVADLMERMDHEAIRFGTEVWGDDTCLTVTALRLETEQEVEDRVERKRVADEKRRERKQTMLKGMARELGYKLVKK